MENFPIRGRAGAGILFRSLAACGVAVACVFGGERANAEEAAPSGTAEQIPTSEPNAPVTKTISHEIQEVLNYAADQAHAACFENNPFPAAAQCRTCHPQHYREWSVSPHAYAQVSPVFNAMQNRIQELTAGTNADFCIRCHTPVGMALNEPINISNLDRPLSSREGVTCIICHRVNQAWGKGAGRRALVPGDINQPVYGPLGSEILSSVIAQPDRYGVLKTSPRNDVRGRDIHRSSHRFFQITTSGFCGACHDVFGPNGFRLEDAFSEYKSSPAAREHGVSCQDCHMGQVPGQPVGYSISPAAVVGNASTQPRKHTNHMIVGPDYSIIHPGLFPHNPDMVREVGDNSPDGGLATLREWLLYDVNAGWGTDEFEENLPEGYQFPEAWSDRLKRYHGRKFIGDQFQLLGEAAGQRHQLLSHGYRLGDIQDVTADRHGIQFRVCVSNGTDGHGVPTGFDAERVVFVRVLVWDRNGKAVFQSGDLDPNGDIRDSHSFFVHNGKLPLDRQLFSLQTKFITRNIRGGEREQILAVPYSIDPLPYIRPEIQPFTVLGRPVGARKHKQNIEVYGKRWAKYKIGRHQLTGCGPYYARVQLIAGMVPVNLVHEVSHVGFDYCMSAKDIAKGVVAGHMVLHERKCVIDADR